MSAPRNKAAIAPATLAAIIALAFVAEAAAQTGEEAVCGIDPNETYAFTGGRPQRNTTHSGTTRPFEPQGDNNYRLALQFHSEPGDEVAERWIWTLKAWPCPTRQPANFAVTEKDVAAKGDLIWSPAFCAKTELSGTPGAPSVFSSRFPLSRQLRQLGVVDGRDDTAPNWCKVSDYHRAAAVNRTSGTKIYAPERAGAHQNFLKGVNSVVALGFVRTLRAFKQRSLDSCTGFFVARDLILTNRHCVCPGGGEGNLFAAMCPDEEPFRSATANEESHLAQFESLNEVQDASNAGGDWKAWTRIASNEEDAPTFQKVAPLLLGSRIAGGPGEPENPLDYALLRVHPDKELPGRIIVPAKLSRAGVAEGMALAVPQYPGNYPFSVNYDSNCKVFPGAHAFAAAKDGYVLHGCDTARGSSGSPVFLRDFSAVVGLHSCCALTADAVRTRPEAPKDDTPADAIDKSNLNRFVSMRSIICDVKKRSAALYDEIALAQGWADGAALDCTP